MKPVDGVEVFDEEGWNERGNEEYASSAP